MQNIRTILFDLDGTVIDTADSIINTYRHTLIEMGVELPARADMMKLIGPGMVYNFTRLVGEERVPEAIALYRDYYANTSMFEAKPYDQMAETLARFKQAGKDMIIATSKFRDFAEILIKHFGFDQFFSSVYGAVSEPALHKKSDIIALALRERGLAPCDTIMIGDRDNDVISAKGNDISSIGALWGYGSEAELRKAGAVGLAAQPRDLLHLILGG
ncbi:MAG: HAD hydrolase-like protein [Alphaproteobacteria bacterium]|nr:HAD hydrolase-like protein [Alphaproteobacteria bacterium]